MTSPDGTTTDPAVPTAPAVPYWPPHPIDILSRDDRTPAHIQHPKDHNDLQVAVNAMLLVLGTQPYGQSDSLTAELLRLQGMINAVIAGGAGDAGAPPVTGDDIARLQSEIDTVQARLSQLSDAPGTDPAVTARLTTLQSALDEVTARLGAVQAGAPGTPLGDRLNALQNSVSTLQFGASGTSTSGVQRFYGEGLPGVLIGARPSDEYVDVLTGDLYVLQ